MARIRTIKPAFFTSPTVASLTLSARLTFIGLWTYVDDEGRGRDETRLIKAELWHLDDKVTTRKVDIDLEEIAERGLIERYEVDSKRFLRVIGWREHQTISHPSPSKFPPPPATSTSTVPPPEGSGRVPGALREPSTLKGREGKGKEGNREGNREQGKERKEDSSSRTSTRGTPSREAESDASLEPGVQDPYVELLLAVCTGKRTAGQAADAAVIVAWLRAHVDRQAIEECIGYCGRLRTRPSSPRFLASTMTKWAAEKRLVLPPVVYPARAAS